MNISPAPDRRTRRSRVAAAVTATLLAGVLTGCGVRLETPPPAEPVPDAAELIRRTAVSDALGVAEVAESALRQPELADDVVVELTRVHEHSLAQADALGGVYDSGIEREPDLELDELGLEATATEEPPAATADVVAALADAAGRSRTAANTAADSDVARLLASIGASQTVGATRLAALDGVEAPAAPQPVVPGPAVQDDDGDDDGAEDEADAQASPDVEGAEPEPTLSPGGVATIAPGGEEVVPPAGISAAEYRAVILAEDGARYALEVLAARSDDAAQRAALVAKAGEHAERARAWAVLAGVVGTDQDPRQAAYVVPRDAETAAIVSELAAGRARDYATLVGTVAMGTRGVLVDLLIDAALTLNTWGAAPSVFPGMPDLS